MNQNYLPVSGNTSINEGLSEFVSQRVKSKPIIDSCAVQGNFMARQIFRVKPVRVIYIEQKKLNSTAVTMVNRLF